MSRLGIRIARAVALLALAAMNAPAQRPTPVDLPRPELPTRLPKPEGLAITQLSATSVRLTWHAVAGARRYLLGRSIGTNGLQRVDVPLSPQTEYTDRDVRVGVRVSYSVTPVDSNGIAGARAISADFVPVTMAPEPVVTADSTAADSTAKDSTATPGTTGGTPTPAPGPTPAPVQKGCPPFRPTNELPLGAVPMGIGHKEPRILEEARVLGTEVAGTTIRLKWGYRLRETGTWEIWDLIDGVAHFVSRMPAGSREAVISASRAGKHIPLLYEPLQPGYAGPVCGKSVVLTEQMLAAQGASAGGPSPSASTTAPTSSASGVSVEVLAPVTVDERHPLRVADVALAQEWMSLDPDVARLESGRVVPASAGTARIVGITSHADGTIRVNVLRATVPPAPPPRHK